jgi:tetraacyldisaccharide 4'-kinase
MILTTEKDAVRLPKIFPKIPLYYLRLEIDILSNEDDFHSLAQRICLPQQEELLKY